jgi:mannosyltransferase
MSSPDLYVTNFNKNFTGVSATAAGVVGVQQKQFEMRLVGQALPNCPNPISKSAAYDLSKTKPDGKPFAIWHVRRNPEMRAAIWARDVLRLPIRIAFTSSAQRRHSLYPRWLISKMDAVIPTTDEAMFFVDNVFRVVPHGVDTARFTPAQNRTAAWQALGYGGVRGVAAIGRVRPEKGTDTFVDTMLRILPKHPDMVALVVGKAAKEHLGFQQKLKDKVAVAGLSDRLLFIGEVAADEMPVLIRALSLLIALPRYEGYGMTPLEGLASGVPFVGSLVGYFDTFSNENKFGKIVPVADAGQAAAAVEAWLADEQQLLGASKLAPGFVKQQHSIETEVAGINAVYEGLWKHG